MYLFVLPLNACLRSGKVDRVVVQEGKKFGVFCTASARFFNNHVTYFEQQGVSLLPGANRFLFLAPPGQNMRSKVDDFVH
jgi:hypothetical protein